MSTTTTKTLISIAVVLCFALVVFTHKSIFTLVLLALPATIFVFSQLVDSSLQVERLCNSYKIISRDSGDMVIRDEFQNLRIRGWRKVKQIEDLLTSTTAYFATPTYDNFTPPRQTATWQWKDETGNARRGITVFDPPIGTSPISFIRESISFNTINFNRRDRLDGGVSLEQAGKERVWQYVQYPHGVLEIQIVFPDGVPTEIWVEARRGIGTTRDPNNRYSRRVQTGLEITSNAVYLVLHNPRLGFSYHIVWKLPEDEDEQLSLSANQTGFAREIEERLRRVPYSDADQQKVRAELEVLRKKLEDTYPSGDLNLSVYVYGRFGDRGSLVCASDLKLAKPNGGQIVIGRTLVGRCYRRKRVILFNTLKHVSSDDFYYEAVPGEEQQDPPTLALCLPLLWPELTGRKVGVLYVTTRSNTTALGRLLEDDTAKAECVALLQGWYASRLILALGVEKTFPANAD